jgi:hypothetical protein
MRSKRWELRGATGQKNAQTGLAALPAPQRRDAQKKQLSSRQKIDRGFLRQQEQLRHSNFLTYTASTSTAMGAGRRRIIGV